MEKLYNLIDELKESLDNEEKVKAIKIIQEQLKEDKKLLELVEEYNRCNNPKLKDEIVKNENFKKYKHLENEINYIIVSINQKLKEINEVDNKG